MLVERLPLAASYCEPAPFENKLVSLVERQWMQRHLGDLVTYAPVPGNNNAALQLLAQQVSRFLNGTIAELAAIDPCVAALQVVDTLRDAPLPAEFRAVLIVPEPRLGRFYLLPKIRKREGPEVGVSQCPLTCPCRLICSMMNHLCSLLSSFIHNLLAPNVARSSWGGDFMYPDSAKGRRL